MKSVLSIILFIVLLLWICKIYLSDKKLFRVVEYNPEEQYLLSRNMYFTILTVCTAPVFLGTYSLLKYGLWFVTILILIVTNRVRMKLETVMTLYVIFFLWLLITMSWTSAMRDGWMMLIKYFIPVLFLWLGYSSLRNEKDLIIFLKVVNFVACVYCMFIGGQGWVFLRWSYINLFMGVFGNYAPFANFLTSVFVIPILLYWLTKEKKYILCAAWMFLSTILESVRTGIGGMMLVLAVATLLKYKGKSLPGLFFAGMAFISVILFVPSVNQKFFGEDAGTVTGEDIIQGDALSLDNIEMNGRDALWEFVMDNCYYGNEVFGGGLGSSGRFIKDYGTRNKSLVVMHNDYLQILCDAGIVGIVLLIIFYLAFIIKVITHVVLRKSTPLIKITGIMALSSMVGIGFSMYFDNVVSLSMQAMVMPYIYWGFFFRSLDIEGKKKSTLAILRFRKERV